MSTPDRSEGQRRADEATRIVLRPLGSSLPLGFLALGGASVVLSGLQLGWLPTAAGHQVAIVVLVFTVPAQLLASVFGFFARDSAAGTGMSVLAASWLSIGVLQLTSPTDQPNPTLGLLLFFACAALMIPVAAAALGKVLAAVVLFMAAIRFALTGIYEFASRAGAGWQHASGWFGVALAVVALYSALAFEIEDTKRATILPVLRWSIGKRAVTGGILDEVERVSREAGVREQL